ncbi:MAG: SulP family inorganic anion transporter [Lachnospiraceae bacterium]|nr:SulP family inorganic anion transporter [Lachnospiraceae bacterium]
MRLISQLKTEGKTYRPGKDIAAGIIVALVSIPIAMGYAQIAGLPPVYGLYGSLLPILVYGLLTTSPRFVVGVDAMPAVMTGGLLATMGIQAESPEALGFVPLVALITGLWFLVFYLIKAGRIVKFISKPVMSGFITGVGLTIILMQVAKMFGGKAGTGELVDLVIHITGQLENWNSVSALLGFGTFAIILIFKKIKPRIPMTIVMLVVGAALQMIFHLDQYGVAMLAEVPAGLPPFVMPDFSLLQENGSAILLQTFSIAAVIMAQTLLATGSYAMKYNDSVDNNAELLAYGAMNVAGAFTGCCPINGSISRSGLADSFGVRSQVMSVVATGVMALVLLFGTPMLKYLPVPVLTGIVLTALWGILDFGVARKLWDLSRNEWLIFMIAFFGVLLFGTVNGVIIGVVLSFFDVAISAVTPPASFLGQVPGWDGYQDMSRWEEARPIRHAVIYRFSGNLFFANVDRFKEDIEGAIKPDTTTVVVDARGITSLDMTAAEHLMSFANNLKNRGIALYITEQDASLNDCMRELGMSAMLESGMVRRTISLALRDADIEKPYDLELKPGDVTWGAPIEYDAKLAEFEWLFGDKAEEMLDRLAARAAKAISKEAENDEHVEAEVLDGHGVHTDWGTVGLFDENEFLDHLELHLEEMLQSGAISEERLTRIEEHIERRRQIGEARLMRLNPHAWDRLLEHRRLLREHLKEQNPAIYARLEAMYSRMMTEHMEPIRDEESGDTVATTTKAPASTDPQVGES